MWRYERWSAVVPPGDRGCSGVLFSEAYSRSWLPDRYWEIAAAFRIHIQPASRSCLVRVIPFNVSSNTLVRYPNGFADDTFEWPIGHAPTIDLIASFSSVQTLILPADELDDACYLPLGVASLASVPAIGFAWMTAWIVCLYMLWNNSTNKHRKLSSVVIPLFFVFVKTSAMYLPIRTWLGWTLVGTFTIWVVTLAPILVRLCCPVYMDFQTPTIARGYRFDLLLYASIGSNLSLYLMSVV